MKIYIFLIILLFTALFAQNHPNSLVIERIGENWDGEYPIIFGVVGDNYSTNSIFRAIIHQLNSISDSLDFVLEVGDLTAGGNSAGYFNYITLIDSLNVPLISVMGNHELNDSLGWNRFIENFGDPNYHLDIGNARFVCLTDCYPAPEPVSGSENVYYMFLGDQLEWLDNLLSDWSGFKFVAIHAPPYLLGHMSIATVGGAGSSPDYDESRTEQFTNILAEQNVYICFGGHIHAYDRWTSDIDVYGNVTYILSGGGGASIVPVWPYPAPYGGPIYHFLIMELYEDGTIIGHLVRPDTIADGITTVDYDSSYEFTLMPPAKVDELQYNDESYRLVVHPNPFNNVINIYTGRINSKIIIYDMSGRIVKTIMPHPGEKLIRWKPDKNIPAGTYTIDAGENKVKIFYIP
ncbi:hypothetical protein DRQ29_01740 [bacterium]|nr:MAG: hypothetical protein DRQ29_01740 [bacterium]